MNRFLRLSLAQSLLLVALAGLVISFATEVSRKIGVHYGSSILAVSPDGSSLAMGVSARPQHRRSHPIPIKNLLEPTASLRTLEQHNFHISGLAWSNDSKTLFSSSGGADRSVRVWDVPSGKELNRIQWPSINPHCLALSPDERFLAIGDDASVHIWDLEAEEEVATLKRFATWLADAAFTPDGRYLVSLDAGGKVQVWSTVDWSLAGSLDRSSSEKLAIASNRLVTAVKQQQKHSGVSVQVRELPGLEIATEFEVDSYSTVDSVAISSGGRFLAAAHGGSDRNQQRRAVTIWDVSNGKELTRHEFERNGNRITGLALDLKSDTANQSNEVHAFDWSEGRVTRIFSPSSVSWTFYGVGLLIWMIAWRFCPRLGRSPATDAASEVETQQAAPLARRIGESASVEAGGARNFV